jgi:GAF domain-containing protein
MASRLDFQAIVEQVGDKLREVFDLSDLGITWYDTEAGTAHYLFLWEHGVRLKIPPQPMLPGGIAARLARDRRPIALNTREEWTAISTVVAGTDAATELVHPLYMYEHGARVDYPAYPARPGGLLEQISRTRQPVVWRTAQEADAISEVLPGTDRSRSGASVPIISNDRVLGALQLENYERDNAYRESDVRLLTTIAASLGAALENAHLFAETQRLLKETEQRNAELATVNSVQVALSSTLDPGAICELIGEVFDVEVVDIVTYDEGADLLTMPYSWERGDRSVFSPRTPYGFRREVIARRSPILVNRDFRGEALKHDNPRADVSVAPVGPVRAAAREREGSRRHLDPGPRARGRVRRRRHPPPADAGGRCEHRPRERAPVRRNPAAGGGTGHREHRHRRVGA